MYLPVYGVAYYLRVWMGVLTRYNNACNGNVHYNVSSVCGASYYGLVQIQQADML